VVPDVPRRSSALRLLLVALLGTALILLAPPQVHAAINGTEFPSASQVKTSMNGKGKWSRSLGDPNFKAIGASPAACRSDLPFAEATEFRNAYYYGSIAGNKKYHGTSEVTVYRFGSDDDAVQAMAGLPGFLTACPKSKEWVCERCDGIATYYRTPAAPRPVGEESVAWNERSVGMGIAKGHAIAARTGATIVVTVVSHQTDPERMKTPPAPTWKQAVSVAGKAVNKAAP